MAERPWYFLNQQQAQQGPVSQAELKQQLAAGVLAPDTLVWSEPMSQWQPAAALPELAVQEAPAGTMALSPSELVVLHAAHFAAKAGFMGSNFSLLSGEGEVGTAALGEQAFTGTLAAMERMGAIRLTVQTKKAMFGLRTVNTLWAESTGVYVPWSEPSLEFTLTGMLAQGPQEVETLVYNLLGEDSSNPHYDAVMHVVQNLKARGLVYEEEVKGFLSTTTRRRATPHAMHLAASQDITWIQQLLGSPNPQFGQLLTAAVKKGIGRRRERDTDSDGPDYDGPDND